MNDTPKEIEDWFREDDNGALGRRAADHGVPDVRYCPVNNNRFHVKGLA
jgi:hypothetical protein